MPTFKHITTDFPQLPDSPIAPNVVFDYTRWEPGTVIRLYNVDWDNQYNDVVHFIDAAKRDAWFDERESVAYRLTAMTRMLPNGSIKVPIPFDVVQRYNYLTIDLTRRPANPNISTMKPVQGSCVGSSLSMTLYIKLPILQSLCCSSIHGKTIYMDANLIRCYWSADMLHSQR